MLFILFLCFDICSGRHTHILGKNPIESADGGKTLSYKNNSIYNVACKEIYLPKGTYDLSFTWKCVGEIDADGLQVFWLSSKIATNSSATSEPTFMKSGKLVFDGREFLCGSKEWKTSTTTLTQQSTTPYKLVFVWKNDASNNTPSLPSIVIDNIQIASQSCGKPENVTATALSTDVTVRWNGGATGYEMMYRLYGEDEVHIVEGINQTSYTLKNMREGVYDLFVRSCCPDDTSIWVVQNNVLVYDPASHCIDFIDWNREGTECRTGSHTIGGSFDGDKFYPNIESISLDGLSIILYLSVFSTYAAMKSVISTGFSKDILYFNGSPCSIYSYFLRGFPNQGSRDSSFAIFFL